MFKIEINRTIASTEQAENLEDTTDAITSSEYTPEKAEKMMQSICSQLTYLDDQNGLDAILKVENHIRTLTNYGNTLEELVETARKQSKGAVVKDLYGSWVVDNATSVE